MSNNHLQRICMLLVAADATSICILNTRPHLVSIHLAHLSVKLYIKSLAETKRNENKTNRKLQISWYNKQHQL